LGTVNLFGYALVAVVTFAERSEAAIFLIPAAIVSTAFHFAIFAGQSFIVAVRPAWSA
jgi:hypothetical protein